MNKLDFILFGLARSGTTAFARCLNIHPNIFCAVESLSCKSDHSAFNPYKDFYDDNVVGAKLAEINERQSRGKAIERFGNKFPGYHFCLEKVNYELGGNASLLGVYRENFGFIPSWNRRTLDASSWPVGKKGIAGIVEQIIFFQCLLNAKLPVRLFSYTKLFIEDAGHYIKLLEEIGVSVDDNILNEFSSTIFGKKRESLDFGELSEVESYFIDRVNIKALDEIVHESSGESFSCIEEKGLSKVVGKMKLEFCEAMKETNSYSDVDLIKYMSSKKKVWSGVDEEFARRLFD